MSSPRLAVVCALLSVWVSACGSAPPADAAQDDTSAEPAGGDGADGTDGADGGDGTDGADGSDGTDGADGSDGSDPPSVEAARAAVQAWFEAELAGGPRSRSGVPGGTELEAAEGGADRAGLPAAVVDSVDHFVRIEEAAQGTLRVDQGSIEGFEVIVLTVTTNRDDAYVECFFDDGTWVTGGRFFASEAPAWDAFSGRVRLAERWTAGFSSPSFEEGFSEADERDAAGQVPLGWSGDVQVLSGQVPAQGSLMGTVDFGTTVLSDEQRAVAVAALELLWGRHLVWTLGGAESGVVALGPDGQGVLSVGWFTRSTTGEELFAADWRDLDDSSYVFYFRMGTWGPELAVEQYDN